MNNGISCIVNTLNEEKNIRDCIKSVKKYVDEIVVVDMESDDNTRTIAKRLGCRVYKIKRVGYVEPARNYAIAKAKYDWILILDADERVPCTLGNKMQEIVNGGKYDLVRIPHKNIIFEKWLKHSSWWPDYHYRLFRKGHFSGNNEIHGAPRVNGKEYTLPALEKYAFIHYGHTCIDHTLGKDILYSKYDKSLRNFIKKNGGISLNTMIYYPRGEFTWRYIEMEGYKDGIHGYMMAKMREYYRFMVILRYWETAGYKKIVDTRELQTYVLEEGKTAEAAEEMKKIKESHFYTLWKMYCGLKTLIFPLTGNYRFSRGVIK